MKLSHYTYVFFFTAQMCLFIKGEDRTTAWYSRRIRNVMSLCFLRIYKTAVGAGTRPLLGRYREGKSISEDPFTEPAERMGASYQTSKPKNEVIL